MGTGRAAIEMDEPENAGSVARRKINTSSLLLSRAHPAVFRDRIREAVKQRYRLHRTLQVNLSEDTTPSLGQVPAPQFQ